MLKKKCESYELLMSAIVLGAIPFLGMREASAYGEIYPKYIGIPASMASDLKWTHDTATVSTTYLNNIITPAFNQWNGVSSKVSVNYTTGTPNLRVLISGSMTDVAAETIPYCSNGQGYPNCAIYNVGYTWTAVRIYGYDAAMNNAGFNQTNKIKTYAHEMGHALAMDHVYADVNAVMIQGKMVIGVQQYDKENLKLRWGS